VTFWNRVLWLHLLGMAFFVGGQLMLAAIVVPVLRRPEWHALDAAIFIVSVAIVWLGIVVAG
jgi:hypothetical protein